MTPFDWSLQASYLIVEAADDEESPFLLVARSSGHWFAHGQLQHDHC